MSREPPGNCTGFQGHLQKMRTGAWIPIPHFLAVKYRIHSIYSFASPFYHSMSYHQKIKINSLITAFSEKEEVMSNHGKVVGNTAIPAMAKRRERILTG